MEYIITAVLTAIFSGVSFFYIGVVYRKKTAEVKIESAENEANKIIEDSKKDSERIKREAIIQAKDEMLKQKDEIE